MPDKSKNTGVSAYEAMSVEELAAEHQKLDEQRNKINSQMVAVDEVRSRKEFETAQQAAAEADAQTTDVAGAESSGT